MSDRRNQGDGNYLSASDVQLEYKESEPVTEELKAPSLKGSYLHNDDSENGNVSGFCKEPSKCPGPVKDSLYKRRFVPKVH